MAEFDNKDIAVPIGKTKVTLEPNVRKSLEETVCGMAECLMIVLAECESPIEQLMCIGLHQYNFHRSRLEAENDIFEVRTQVHVGYDKDGDEEFNAIFGDEFLKDKKYRVDFMVEIADQRKNKNWFFVIECDSKKHHFTEPKFHEDRQRDRALLSAGIITLRFTGEEINKSHRNCAGDVYKTIYDYVSR